MTSPLFFRWNGPYANKNKLSFHKHSGLVGRKFGSAKISQLAGSSHGAMVEYGTCNPKVVGSPKCLVLLAPKTVVPGRVRSDS